MADRPISSSPIRQSPGTLAPLYKALAKAQGEYPPIEKTKLARVTSKEDSRKLLYTYTYADLAGIMGPLRPVLAKHGLSVQHLPLMRVDRESMVVVCRLAHESGCWIEAEYPVSGVSGAINHQTLGGALAYAKRQSYCAVTGVVAEEEGDESDVEDGKVAPPGERREREPDPKPAAGPPRRSAPKQEDVTVSDREKLRRMGFKEGDIAGMKPETAKAFIRNAERPAPFETDAGPDERNAIIVDMARPETSEALKQWHADNADRIMREGTEWSESVFYPRYDDRMAALKAIES